jgi:AcrR family transcriptional regulator
MPSSLSFVQFLESRLKDNAPRQKGARTRERIKIATAKMLGERGYHQMRVTDITKCAGISEGSFYVYFNDKKDASLNVLSEFLKDFIDLRAPPEDVAGEDFQTLRMANRRWVALCRANSGLMRCAFQVGDQEADFARLVQRTNKEWYSRMAQSAHPRHAGVSDNALLLATYFLCSMMDELIRKLIVYPDREFHKILKSWAADDNAIADAATLIWIRVMGAEMQLPKDLPPITMDLADLLWGTMRREPERSARKRAVAG